MATVASEHELLGRHLAQLAADVRRLDPLVRDEVTDAVHQLRVRVRRIRSTLRIFHEAFDPAAAEAVRADLAWLGDALGRPRDLEVLRQHLDELLQREPAELVRDRIDSWTSGRLRAEYVAAYRDALGAMTSERYGALLDTVDTWATEPPWAQPKDRPAGKRLPKALDRACRRLERSVARAAASSGAERATHLHGVRRRAKRTRYAAETLVPVLGEPAVRKARAAEKVQDVLGDFHDAVVAAGHVRRLADEARAEGRDVFTLGVLHARIEAEAAEREDEFERVWKRVRREFRAAS